jgi:hypothetical protein
LAGGEVDWSTKVLMPRTLSWISTWISPSEKRVTRDLPRGVSRKRATSSAMPVFDVPVKILMPSLS